uniref:Uncharacterized protein n=1 Tax=Ciona savignyi TaxID=51511 RepID=H2Z3T3_CIOSA
GDPILQPAGGGKRFAIPKLVVQKLEEIPPLFTNIKVGDTVEIDWDGLDDITGAFGSRSVFRAPGRTGTVVGFDGVKDPEVLFQGGVKKIIPIKLVKKVELGREFSEFREAKPSSKTTKSFQPSNKETAPKMVHKFKVGSQVCVRKKFSEFL